MSTQAGHIGLAGGSLPGARLHPNWRAGVGAGCGRQSLFDAQPTGKAVSRAALPVVFNYSTVQRRAVDIVQRHRHRRPVPQHLLRIDAHWAADAADIFPVDEPLACCSIGDGDDAVTVGRETTSRWRDSDAPDRVAVLVLSGADCQGTVLARRMQLLVACHDGGAQSGAETLYWADAPSGAAPFDIARAILKEQAGIDGTVPDDALSPFADFVYRTDGVTSLTRVILAKLWTLPAPVQARRVMEVVQEEVEVIEECDVEEDGGAEPAAKRARREELRNVTRHRGRTAPILQPRLVPLQDLAAPHALPSAGSSTAFELLATADMVQEVLERQCAGGCARVLRAVLERRRAESTLRRRKEEGVVALNRQRAGAMKEQLRAVKQETEGKTAEERKSRIDAVQRALNKEWTQREKEAVAKYDAELRELTPSGVRKPCSTKLQYFGMFDRGAAPGLLGHQTMTLVRSRLELALSALGDSLSGTQIAELVDVVSPDPQRARKEELPYADVAVVWEPAAAAPAAEATAAE